jgi:perosamine synthetase
LVPHNRPSLAATDAEALARVLNSGHIAQGPEVQAFEQEIAARFGRPGWHAVAVSSGTAALYLALRALGVGPGHRVLIPTYVCTALIHAIRLTGAEPSLCDIREDDFNLDPLTAPAHAVPHAVIVPHTYGVPSDITPLRALGVPVIEDAAQALGARFRDVPVGSLGDLAVCSFYATKPLTCGQGGMILGPKEACDEMRDRRDYDGKHELKPRFNFQMSDLAAALGRSQLRRFDEFLARRRETARLYADALPKQFRTQQPAAGAEPNHFRFVVRLEEVEAARQRFADADVAAIVPTAPWELLHRQMDLPQGQFSVAEHVARTTLSLPIQPSLSDEDRRRVAAGLVALKDLA